ncbi:SMP domain-containing protein [Caenorhabditis elegans]|uniref:SMP domain-containing protein n=1 Tax=Caenorhabditis elegans TaxID=6239 RepID=G5EDK7_CAEEL|nr:SMP domain-containing protein [Caenorhabditis elegans]NP_494019.1 SMP domain-containing protein [Caenorhabditis elegans]CCD63665.1 SMP domain-containing protein [Caenorhabditis elegans]CCD63678.1 SMP domain-containing protein [Caenorhabditis elegans]|eukprot:NP_494018.1 Uncharacterized protein CELE_C08E3.13 [Caenorhabditis elegans]
MPTTPRSQPGTVGKDMAGALAGRHNDMPPISSNYQGRPGNANPNYGYQPSADNARNVADWTKAHMKTARENAAAKRNN